MTEKNESENVTEGATENPPKGGITVIEVIVLLSIITLIALIIYFDRKYSGLQIDLENKNCICLESM